MSKTLLEKLEEERQFAIKVKEPIMALGIAQAMRIVEEHEKEVAIKQSNETS